MINGRVTFNKDNLRMIKIAASLAGLSQKAFMERAILADAIMTVNTHSIKNKNKFK